MKKFFAVLVVILAGASFLGLSAYLKGRGNAITSVVEKIDNKCTNLGLNCQPMSSIFNELHNSGEGIKRSSISKDKLPVVRIYMSDGAVEKLDGKRKSVLAKPRPIHIAEDKDWVKATVLIEYAQRKEKSKASLRLKGDWGDHLEDPKKLSFRIKTRGGGYLFGMKALSIQHPKTRNYANEPMLLDHMRAHDILAPRYKFVDVFVNDFPIGIMAVEEHARKEMIEAQNRRDGPLLAVSESTLWDQWEINYNSDAPAGVDGYNFSGHRDLMIKDFNKSKFTRGTIPTNNTIRGHALLRDFFNADATSREAFDYEKLSKYWILVNIWNGCHSAVWHNRRYYFNPISGLLEPIGFDNIPHPEYFKTCTDVDIKTALKDPQFLEQVAQSAEQIYEELQSSEFHKTLSDSQKLYNTIFDYESFASRSAPVTPELLIKNLNSLLTELSKDYDKYGKVEQAYIRLAPKVIGQKFLKEQDELALHMSSFYYPSDNGGSFEFRNLTLDPIDVKRVYSATKKGKETPLNVDGFGLGSSVDVNGFAIIPAAVPEEILAKRTEFTVEYNHKGTTYTRPVFVQFKDSPTGFAADPIAAIRKVEGHQWVDVTGKQVVLAAGPHNFTESIALPKGWKLRVQAGAQLNFKDGALLKLQGQLSINGTKAMPVLLNVQSNTTYRDMGSWGGLVVSKSPERSSVKYLKLKGNGVQNLNTRQGFYGMTGCMSFYESDVDITNSAFTDAQCEDALNIVKADFILDNITIDGARADAFDSDFSTGLIKNSAFIASGNDGIDVSGTLLNLENIIMEGIGDKAVSVGEKSTLRANGIKINGAVLGLVSKDLSDAAAKNVDFENISGTAIMTYIKKQEYGPSFLSCDDCNFLGDMAQTGAQETTIIKLDGKQVRRQTLTKKQMYEAGLIEEGA